MMRGWMMPSHRGMSSHLISGAATQGVPPCSPHLTEHPKPMLSFPLPVINSSTFFFFFFLITIALHGFFS